jgi:hypothetical protein
MTTTHALMILVTIQQDAHIAKFTVMILMLVPETPAVQIADVNMIIYLAMITMHVLKTLVYRIVDVVIHLLNVRIITPVLWIDAAQSEDVST